MNSGKSSKPTAQQLIALGFREEEVPFYLGLVNGDIPIDTSQPYKLSSEPHAYAAVAKEPKEVFSKELINKWINTYLEIDESQYRHDRESSREFRAILFALYYRHRVTTLHYNELWPSQKRRVSLILRNLAENQRIKFDLLRDNNNYLYNHAGGQGQFTNISLIVKSYNLDHFDEYNNSDLLKYTIYLAKYMGNIRRSDLIIAFDISLSKAYRILKYLVEDDKLIPENRHRNRRYHARDRHN